LRGVAGGRCLWIARTWWFKARVGGVDYFRDEARGSVQRRGEVGRDRMKTGKFLVSVILTTMMIGNGPLATAAGTSKPVNAKKFDRLATAALAAMRQKAAELNIQGVAVLNYAPGDSVENWSSKMAVVGRMTDPVASNGKGNNLLAIAYAKSSEMARTLMDSGTAKGTPMTAEFFWQGGVIFKASSGYVIVAFSGGKSEDDVQVSKAGLEVMKAGL
jgi:uncharacterized protein GlcG (DUF336 family)